MTKYETWDEQCSGCGRTNRLCICDPRGGFFTDSEEKRQYQRTHPDSKRRVSLFTVSAKENLFDTLKRAYPEKSDEEIQSMIDKII
jgi:hypothetical protein